MSNVLLISGVLITLTAVWFNTGSIPVEVINRGETLCEEHSGLKRIAAGTLFGVTLPYTVVCENGLVIKLKEDK